MIDLFVDILNEAYAFVWYIFAMACDRLQLLTIFSECSILDVWKSSECTSGNRAVSWFVLNNFSENGNHSYTKHSQSSLLPCALFHIQRLLYSLYNSKILLLPALPLMCHWYIFSLKYLCCKHLPPRYFSIPFP